MAWFSCASKGIPATWIFPSDGEIPLSVKKFMTKSLNYHDGLILLEEYEKNDYRYRHIPIIRNYLGVKSFKDGGSLLLIKSLSDAAQTKDDLDDLINFSLEILVKKRFELPGFSTFVREAQRIRHLVNKATFLLVSQSLSATQKSKLELLFAMNSDSAKSFWSDLKDDPGPATVKNMRVHAEKLNWLISLDLTTSVFETIPYTRYRRFVAEAKSLDRARMLELTENKRITLAAALVRSQLSVGYDDLAEMFIKICSKMHWLARKKLEEIQLKNQSRADQLISVLAEVTKIFTHAKGLIMQNSCNKYSLRIAQKIF